MASGKLLHCSAWNRRIVGWIALIWRPLARVWPAVNVSAICSPGSLFLCFANIVLNSLVAIFPQLVNKCIQGCLDRKIPIRLDGQHNNPKRYHPQPEGAAFALFPPTVPAPSVSLPLTSPLSCDWPAARPAEASLSSQTKSQHFIQVKSLECLEMLFV